MCVYERVSECVGACGSVFERVWVCFGKKHAFFESVFERECVRARMRAYVRECVRAWECTRERVRKFEGV